MKGYVGRGFKGGGGGCETGRKGVAEMRGMLEKRAANAAEEKFIMKEVQ